jgi:hypothetical protein
MYVFSENSKNFMLNIFLKIILRNFHNEEQFSKKYITAL